jgi:hypothetical protein
MSQQIVKDYNIEALKTAAGWPGADRATGEHALKGVPGTWRIYLAASA